jgi:uncharacterized membrane protein
MGQEVARFRSPFLFYIPAIVFGSLVPAAIVLLIELIKGKRIQLALKVFIMTFLVVLPVMLILIIVVTYTYVIEIDTNGIYSYNPHNSWKREFLEWSSINKAMFKNVFGLRYILVLSHDNSRWLWLPSSIIDKKTFLNILSSRLGNDNQLVKLLADV